MMVYANNRYACGTAGPAASPWGRGTEIQNHLGWVVKSKLSQIENAKEWVFGAEPLVERVVVGTLAKNARMGPPGIYASHVPPANAIQTLD